MLKKPIYLQIIPTYRCNKNCTFCLYGHLKDNENTMSLTWLEETLEELSHVYDVRAITLTGGEITTLSDFYLEILIRLCKLYTKQLDVETNLKVLSKALINNCDSFDVSLNFNNFDSELDTVFPNIKALNSNHKSISIKTLDRSCENNPDNIIQTLNSLAIKSWEIIPFHNTAYIPYRMTSYSFYEKVLDQYLKRYREMKFSFQNKLQIDGIYKHDNYNVATVYLTPFNKLAIQYFENNNVFLKDVESLDDLSKSMKELEEKRDKICGNCKYKLRCLANRFFDLGYTGDSCDGAKVLLSSKIKTDF